MRYTRIGIFTSFVYRCILSTKECQEPSGRSINIYLARLDLCFIDIKSHSLNEMPKVTQLVLVAASGILSPASFLSCGLSCLRRALLPRHFPLRIAQPCCLTPTDSSTNLVISHAYPWAHDSTPLTVPVSTAVGRY